MYLLQNASQKNRRIVINRRLEKCLHMMPKKKKEILNTSNSFRSRSFENRSRCYIFKNNSLENVNFQWNIKWKEKMIYFCHLSVFHWTLTFLKELLINFILVYFLVSSYVALFYISKGVRKNVSIISERSSKRCKENRSITLCQKEQSESTVINANFSKSAPSSKKNNNRKPFKKYIRLVFNEI